MDKRADVIPDEAAAAYLQAATSRGGDKETVYERVKNGLAAAAPLLPGGEEAERLIRSLWDLWGEERIATQMGADTVERFKRVLAHPDAERAPQEDRCERCGHPPHAPTSACPASYGFGPPSMPVPTRSSEPRPQGDEVETVTDVWHQDGPLAQIEVMAQWVAELPTEHVETRDKIAKNLRSALAALDARSGADRPEGSQT